MRNSKNLILVFSLICLVLAAGACSSGSSSGSGGGSVVSSSAPGTTGAQLPSGTGTAILGWEAPQTNDDGTPLTDLAGFKVYIGTEPGIYAKSIDAGNTVDYTVADLGPGTYYFTVTAYDQSGSESTPSSEVSKTIS